MYSKSVYFGFYCITFLMFGGMVTSVGPIIPYFSQYTGKPQPYYSFILLARAIGYLIGSSVVKILLEKYNMHHILSGSILLGGFSFMCSALSITVINLSITILIGSLSCCIISVVCNVCVMQIFKRQEQDYRIQILQILLGIGGFLGPIFTSFQGIRTYLYLGIFLMLLTPIFLILESPENRKTDRATEVTRTINRTVEILICLLFFIYLGEQIGFGSWISSYAVMQGIATPQSAAIASSIFWITTTVFRVLFLYVKLKISIRLKVLMIGMIITHIICLTAALTNYQWFATYFGSFFSGIFLSSLFALFMTLPLQFGFKLSKQNTANFMMSGSLGDGILAMPIGYAMGYFGPWMLFFLQLVFAVASFIIFMRVISILQNQNKSTFLIQKSEQIEINEKVIDIRI